MPVIEVHLLAGRSKEKKAKLAKALTAAAIEALGVRPESVRVMLSEHLEGDFYVAGEALGLQMDAKAGQAATKAPPAKTKARNKSEAA